LIYLLVPGDGLLAAAIASAIGYFVLLVLITIYAIKLGVRLSIDWKRVVGGAALFGVSYSIGAVLASDHGVAGLFERSIVLLMSVVLVGRMSGMRVSTVIGRIRGIVLPRDVASRA